jgi:hypothetical protein
VRFVSQLRPRCLLFANIVAFATPKNRVYRHTPVGIWAGCQPAFLELQPALRARSGLSRQPDEILSKLDVPIWRHSVKEVFMSLWILGSCFNVRLFILGWSLLRFSHILLPKWLFSAANLGQTCAWEHPPYSYDH